MGTMVEEEGKEPTMDTPQSDPPANGMGTRITYTGAGGEVGVEVEEQFTADMEQPVEPVVDPVSYGGGRNGELWGGDGEWGTRSVVMGWEWENQWVREETLEKMYHFTHSEVLGLVEATRIIISWSATAVIVGYSHCEENELFMKLIKYHIMLRSVTGEKPPDKSPPVKN